MKFLQLSIFINAKSPAFWLAPVSALRGRTRFPFYVFPDTSWQSRPAAGRGPLMDQETRIGCHRERSRLLAAAVVTLGVFFVASAGCGRRRESTVIVPDEKTAAAEAAKMEAYNKQYEQSLQDPNQE